MAVPIHAMHSATRGRASVSTPRPRRFAARALALAKPSAANTIAARVMRRFMASSFPYVIRPHCLRPPARAVPSDAAQRKNGRRRCSWSMGTGGGAGGARERKPTKRSGEPVAPEKGGLRDFAGRLPPGSSFSGGAAGRSRASRRRSSPTRGGSGSFPSTGASRSCRG
jgi:hypothetical protein